MMNDYVTSEFVQGQLAKAKSYTLVFLTSGVREVKEGDETAASNQMLHLQYLFTLKEQNHLSIFGPLTDSGKIRGILIFNSAEEALINKMMDEDPHVKKGYLSYEMHPWFGIPGQVLAG